LGETIKSTRLKKREIIIVFKANVGYSRAISGKNKLTRRLGSNKIFGAFNIPKTVSAFTDRRLF